jgi:histidyl-tRNA synthetase
MSQIDLQPVKGTRDLYPEDMRVRTWLFGQWREVAKSFGFEEYDACVLEHAELYIRKAGDEITKQLYEFRDKGDRHVALRPELTPSFARMVMAKGASLPLPARWFSLPQCFRYEDTQKGRKREHYQWNMDIVGLASVAAEAELMAAQAEFCRRAGLQVTAGAEPEVVWKVSNRHVLGHFLECLGIDPNGDGKGNGDGSGSGAGSESGAGSDGLSGYGGPDIKPADQFAAVCVCIDKRGKIPDNAILDELLKVGVTPPVGQKILDLLDVRGLDKLAQMVPADNAGLLALRELHELAASFGIGHLLKIDLSVIRGLSYYTGTVWEVFAQVGTIRRAVAGGGRYDKLCEQLGGTAIPMVGFGFGDVVISELLAELGRLPTFDKGIDDVVFPMSGKEFAPANRIAASLRRQGRRVSVDYSGRRFKHVIERAENDGAKRLFILGGNEIKEGVVVERILGAAEKQERKVPLSEF